MHLIEVIHPICFHLKEHNQFKHLAIFVKIMGMPRKILLLKVQHVFCTSKLTSNSNNNSWVYAAVSEPLWKQSAMHYSSGNHCFCIFVTKRNCLYQLINCFSHCYSCFNVFNPPFQGCQLFI